MGNDNAERGRSLLPGSRAGKKLPCLSFPPRLPPAQLRAPPSAALPLAYPYFVSMHLFWMTTDKQRISPTATVPQMKPSATTKESVFPDAGVEEGAEVINPKETSC